jgi:small subunit ribosomal protein S20
MPNIKSAKKRVKVIKVKTLQNQMFRSQMRTMIKKYDAALATGDKEQAFAAYKVAVKKIDQAVCRGILHKNAAARKKSQFTVKLNKMA